MIGPEQEANARFQAGLRYYDAREFEPARLAFTQAYSVLPKPGILINLALSELYAGHELEALSHLEQYLADPSAPAEKRDRAQRALDEAMKKTSHLSIKSSASAEVKVDNKLVSLTTVHVMPGTHALEARAGEKVRSQSVDVKAGEKRDVDLSFDAPTQPVAVTPPPIAPPPGGDVTPPPKVEEGSSSTRYIVAGSLAAVGLVGIGLGVGFTLSASGASKDLDDAKSKTPNGCSGVSSADCSARSTAADDYASRSTTRNFMFIGGGAFLIGGVAAFLLWPTSKSSALVKTPRVVPMVGANGSGFIYRGEF